MKKNLVAYSHAPISPGVKGLHIMLFKLLECYEDDFNVFVLSRTKECYEYYIKDLQPKHPFVNLVSVPDNISQDYSSYQFGLVEKMLEKTVGTVDVALWFWPGMSIVTPEERIGEVYKNLANGTWSLKSISVKGKIDAEVVQQGEMLYSVIKSNPHFIYRVGDYTEPHIEKVIPYPMKMVSYYPNEKLHHTKIHDAEWLHFSEPIPEAEKKYDFIFGYTVEIPERAYLSDFCFEHIKQDDKVKLFVKDKHFSRWSPIDTQLPSDVYFDMLRYAKFSLIAPSTDPTELSLNRVYEDMVRRCVPLFMKDVQYWKAFDDEVNEFIKQNLIYDEEKWPLLNDFIAQLDYEHLIEKLLSFKMFKEFRDKEHMKKLILSETL